MQDRFGLVLICLVGSFVTLGFADSTWALVLAGVFQVGAVVVTCLATRLFARPPRSRRPHRHRDHCRRLLGAGAVGRPRRR